MNIYAIKQAVPMPQLAERYGVQVRRGMCCCPFHGDKHPSMKIYPDGFHCFACGAHGDVIAWVERFDAVGFTEACKRLSSWYGIDTVPTPKPSVEDARAARANAYAAACEKVRQTAPKSPEEQPSAEFWEAVKERNRLEEEGVLY